MADPENYRARAAQARLEADDAALQNVRERCLRAEAAWIGMAARQERSERSREAAKALKAAAQQGSEED